MTRRLFCAATTSLAQTGWQTLFDGHSLSGWRWDRDGETTNPSWQARDGLLCATPGQGNPVYLITNRTFTDFDLRWEWKTEKGGNSGVKYRIQTWGASARRLEPTGLEYQITDDEFNSDALSTPKHAAGAIYEYVAPLKASPAQADRWHSAAIVVRGTQIEHWLDGAKVVDIDLHSARARDQFSQSRRGSKDMLRLQEKRQSPLALQIHDGVVCFRNLRILPL